MNSLTSINIDKENFDEFNVRSNFAKRVKQNSSDEPSKKAAFIDEKGDVVVFKVPGKASKQKTLLTNEFFIMPVSTSYVTTCYMALYLKKLSVISPSEYKDLLEIFNNSLLKEFRLSAYQLFTSLKQDEVEDYFPGYVEHLVNSEEECNRTQKLNNLSPKELPKNIQVYKYLHNSIGIHMDIRTFSDPSKNKIRILETPFYYKNGEFEKVFYSVVIKR